MAHCTSHGHGGTLSPSPSEVGQRVHSDQRVCIPSVETRTRPNPVRRRSDQSAADRIVVNVVNHLQNRCGLERVAVEASAALPESMHDRAVGLRFPELVQECGGGSFQKSDRSLSDREFDRRADRLDFGRFFARPNKNVDMLRHDDIRPQTELEPGPCRLEGIDEPTTSSIAIENRQTMERRKRQFMGVARNVECLQFLSMAGHAR
jgi:hypothetical protein